jgi:adenylate kinase
MNILLLGPPGAGKGTQGERVARRLGVPKLATGDILRQAVREGTPMGSAAKGFMSRGELVPDDVILGIMKEALARPEMSRGVVLDGVVRTVPQAEGLTRVFEELGRGLDCVLMFDVSDDEVVRRLGGRTVCEICQTPFTGKKPGDPCEKPGCTGRLIRRPDDEPESIRTRMRAYREQTEPVIAWYRDQGTAVAVLDAEGEIDDVSARVMDVLPQCKE